MQPLKPFAHYSLSEVFSKKDVLRAFAKFTRKHLCQSLFTKLHASVCNFIKKKLWHRCFPVNFAKFLRTSFPTGYLRWLLLLLLVTIDKFCCIVFKKQMLAVLKRSAALKICGKMSIIKCNFSVATTSLL